MGTQIFPKKKPATQVKKLQVLYRLLIYLHFNSGFELNFEMVIVNCYPFNQPSCIMLIIFGKLAR